MAKGNTIRKERRGRVPVNASRPRTRGQRGKLHDPATNTAELTAQLRAMGLYAAPTLGDGNCLFRALSDQMYGTADKHLPLRQEICAYMAAHKSRFEAFVDDDRSWDQHISTMCKSGTYGGHLELTAFAQLKVVNVKVVQPGLVYVIEGSKTEVGGASGCAAGASAVVGEEMSSKERRKARKERMRKKSEEKDDDDDDDDYGGDPFPATVYVAYHDWEHFSSVRNLTGPHTGPPEVCEVPEPETSSLPSPPPSKATKSSRKQPATQQPTPDSSSPSPPPPSRSPKRAMDEEDEEEDEGRKRGRRGTITRLLEDEDGAESTGVSASAESFISDAPPPPPEPEPEPAPEPEKLTKRQRKSLGVPKSKAARASVGKTRAKAPVSAKAATSTKAATASKAKSNSTLTTPAKRETRSATKAYRDAGKVRDLGTGEWLDNGTGRLDVRGFRELRI